MYQRELTLRNEEAAAADGAAYIFERNASVLYPPHWQKVFSAQRLLEKGECGVVVFLDCDAVLRRPPRQIVEQMRDRSFLMTASQVFARGLHGSGR